MPDAIQTRLPGKYRAKQNMKIRGTPTHKQGDGNFTGNMLTTGKMFDVYRVVENVEKSGEQWGVITIPDVSQTLYVCLYELNNVHADYVAPLDNAPLQLGGVYTIEYLDNHTVRLTPKL